MKRLPKSLHESLMLLAREEESLGVGFSTKNSRIHHSNKLKLHMRGYAVSEGKKNNNGWTFKLWLSDKAKTYIALVRNGVL